VDEDNEYDRVHSFIVGMILAMIVAAIAVNLLAPGIVK